MAEFAKEILPTSLEQEMRDSYMEYAMSVIVGRALPDVRDGLKPVHRRALYAMYEQNNYWNRPYKKSARIVGDVMGKYHPHGDSAIYDTIVRMAQPFSLRYTLVDGQGNFGSVDGDNPAAMRYTEIRMEKIAHELMADLEKETVDFAPNYDGSEHEPTVLPTRFPNLLVNGSSGIAVGMATNIPPHSLKEVVNGCIELISNPEASLDELMTHIPGPDFPTAAMINGAKGIRDAYETGRGKIYLRAKAHFEENEASGKTSIIVTELPYQVNKARLIEKIAELVKDKKIEGITELRDESDKDGMRMVVELRRGEVGEVMLNNLYQQTQLQTVFGINMVALIDGQPKTLNLKEVLEAFLRHRREVVTRRTLFDLRKARERAHVLEGLSVALANVDEVIEMIKASPSPVEAKEKLLGKRWASGVVKEMLSRAGADACRPEDLGEEYGLNNQDGLYQLSPVQAQAILDLRLHRLTGLEQDKIIAEYKEILEKIEDLLDILQSPERLMRVIREELEEVVENFGDERRTEIIENKLDLTLEDLITEEDRVVTLSHAGYVKSQKLEDYQSQNRGGRGKAATKMKDEDFIDQLLVASTHDMILIFTNKGQVYWKKVYELPQGSRTAKGIPIVNLLPLDDDERVSVILPLRDFGEEQYVFFATQNGTVKKTPLVDYSRPRANGIRAIDLREGDELIGAAITNGQQNIMLVANSGKGIRFKESDVRSMGRVSAGVRGIRLEDTQKVVSLLVLENEDSMILTATENGYGKRTPFADHKVQGRGGSGVIAIQTSERNGAVIGAVAVEDEGEIMLITSNGTLVRTKVSGVSVVGRNTQGVTLIRLDKGDKLVGLERVLESEEDEDTIDGEESSTDAQDTPTEEE